MLCAKSLTRRYYRDTGDLLESMIRASHRGRSRRLYPQIRPDNGKENHHEKTFAIALILCLTALPALAETDAVTSASIADFYSDGILTGDDLMNAFNSYTGYYAIASVNPDGNKQKDRPNKTDSLSVGQDYPINPIFVSICQLEMAPYAQ